MTSRFIIDATKPYLDYLDKEMTIQGVLSAFCMLVTAGVLDRVIAADASKRTNVIIELQTSALAYLAAAITALVLAAWFFYWQRADLAEVHGDLSRATTRETLNLKIPKDSYSVEQAIDKGDSWKLWHPYKWGLALLAVSVTEFALAIVKAEWRSWLPDSWDLRTLWWILPPFVLGFLLYRRLTRDERGASNSEQDPQDESSAD